MSCDEPPAIRRPLPAEVARCAVASARVATVRMTCGRLGNRLVIARFEPSDSGELSIRLDAASALVTPLEQRRAVMITIAAPVPFSALSAIGLAGPQRSSDAASTGSPVFTVEPAALTLHGPRGRTDVDLEEFWAVEDDPLAAQATRMLTHLGAVHGEELTACVRANLEPAAEWVLPRTLDRFGLGLSVMTADGVSDAMLGFPNAPIRSMREVAMSLRVALACPCQPGNTGGNHDHTRR